MNKEREFWQRQVTDVLTVELLPGDQPCISIVRDGESLVTLELSEARKLIEALNVAVGELFILLRDPATLARVETLLAQDVTLAVGDDGQRPVTGNEGEKNAIERR